MLSNFKDIHSHRFLGENTIHNVFPKNIEEFIKEYPYQSISIGIHPWNIPEKWEEVFPLIEKYAQNQQVVALGETGLDKKCTTDFFLQKQVFERHILLSERLEKPLILHIVSAYDELLHYKNLFKPKQQWVIHGFRGNEILAKQLLEKNIFLSLGEKYNPNTLKFLRKHTFFTETDESLFPIKELREQMKIKD
jgi:TatD DNase family protein